MFLNENSEAEMEIELKATQIFIVVPLFLGP